MTVGHKISEYEKEILADLSALIKIPSVKSEPLPDMPFGKPCREALDFMLDRAREFGFKTECADGYAGHVDFGEGGDLIAVLVHLDVVPAGDGWSFEPFCGQIRDGRVLGRGADDNKAPAVAALYALKALKDSGVNPKNTIRLIFGCDEECGMSDMEYYFSKYPMPKMGFSPDCEYPIVNCEKTILQCSFTKKINNAVLGGRAIGSISGGTAANTVPDKASVYLSDGSELVTALGVSAHASTPDDGKNAISILLSRLNPDRSESDLAEFLSFLNEKIGFETDGASIGVKISDDVSGQLTLNLATIAFDGDEIKAVADLRIPVKADSNSVISRLENAAKEYGAAYTTLHLSKGNYVPETHPMISALRTAYEKITSDPCLTLSIGGGTYARTLGGMGVCFGNAGGINYHSPDESVPIDGLMRHAQICTQAIYELAFI